MAPLVATNDPVDEMTRRVVAAGDSPVAKLALLVALLQPRFVSFVHELPSHTD